jgi:hypothetical protein
VLETSHVIVAAAIGYKIDPYLSFPLAFASHFVLETIPHWNPHLMTEMKKFGKITEKSKAIIVVDVLLSLFCGFFIASMALPDTTRFLTIILCAFLGVLPDLIEAPYFFLNKRGGILEWWVRMQKSIQSDTNLTLGMISQAAVALISIFWIYQ